MRRALLVVVAAVALGGGVLLLRARSDAGPSGPVALGGALAGESPTDAAAAYLTVTAPPGTELRGASTPVAERVTLHRNAGNEAVSFMEEVDRFEVPGSGRLELRPGGSHLMLEGLRRPLEAGDSFALTVDLGGGTNRTVEVRVVPLPELAEEVTP